jgi:hypothetical protein
MNSTKGQHNYKHFKNLREKYKYFPEKNHLIQRKGFISLAIKVNDKGTTLRYMEHMT